MAFDHAVFFSGSKSADILRALGAIETISDPSTSWIKVEKPELIKFSDEVALPIYDSDKLKKISWDHRCSFLIVAFESTQDLFFFELIEQGNTRRKLCYGFEEIYVWTQAEGDEEEWESEMYDDEDGEVEIGTDNPSIAAKIVVDIIATYYRLPGQSGTYFDISRYAVE